MIDGILIFAGGCALVACLIGVGWLLGSGFEHSRKMEGAGREAASRGMTQEEWKGREEDFKRAVGSLPEDNGLWPGLVGFLDRHVAIETEALCQAQIGDEELRRGQGRLGMVIELRGALAELPGRIRKEAEAANQVRKAEGGPVQMKN